MSRKLKTSGLPPLDWLRVFEAAGRHGNFTAAATEFGSTQAAVSQRIRNLETWLGRQLFLRAPRGVTLTVEGESYLPLVRDTLQALAQGTEDLFGQSPKEVRIAALSPHLDTLVLPRIAPFLAAHPDLRLVTDSVPKRSGFDAEETALQVRYGRGDWPARQARLLDIEVVQPMAAAGLRNWRDLPLIEIRGERSSWRDWARATGQDAPKSAQISVDSMAHGLRAAQLGQGVVLGSKVLARTLLEAGQIELMTAPELTLVDGYWLTWPDSFAQSRKRRALVLELASALAS
jgi:LysR family transcriptional regulator, glycine cleavage system transcriptional activator